MLKKALVSLLTLVLCSASGQAQKSFSVQDYLANLEYYKFANVHIFETDRPTAQRFLELVPKENIWQVFVITTKANSGEASSILGAVATPKPSPAQRNNPDFVSSKLARVDIGSIFTSEQLRGFPSQTGSAKEFIAKPLGKTLLEHCAANIKQGVFANVTASLRPQFSPEVADLVRKGVFVVQPRGILPVPKSVTALPPDKAAFAVIDDEALLHLTRWQWVGSDDTEGREFLQNIQTLFRQNAKPNVDSTLILTGTAQRSGKYRIYEIRCGAECMNKKEIENIMPQEILDKLSEPVGECRSYEHNILTVSFQEFPLPLIKEQYEKKSKYEPILLDNTSSVATSLRTGVSFYQIRFITEHGKEEQSSPRRINEPLGFGLDGIREAYKNARIGRDAIQEYQDYLYFLANPNAPPVLQKPIQPKNFVIELDLSKFAPLSKDEYWAEGVSAIDYYSDSTDVQVFLNDGGRDVNASWSPSPLNLGISKSEIKGSSHIVSISVRDLPAKRMDEERILQGSVELKTVINRKKADGTTMREAKRVVVPIKKEYK
jgi:hypothetical protein